MARVTDLTVGQAISLSRLIKGLRLLGFDTEAGLYSANLHACPRGDGRLDWWMESDGFVANGLFDATGHGMWWLRACSTPRTHVA